MKWVQAFVHRSPRELAMSEVFGPTERWHRRINPAVQESVIYRLAVTTPGAFRRGMRKAAPTASANAMASSANAWL
jgi:hypothetical protein